MLRDYQSEAKQRIEEAFRLGIRHQVVCLPTGAGKTFLFAHIISEMVKKTGKKALVLAHRGELLAQAQIKLERVDPTLRIEVEKAERRADHHNANVIIASVQSLGKSHSVRISRFNPKDFCIILIDETHHFSIYNSSYTNIIRYFGVLKGEPINDWNTDCLLLGVTATPQRSDHVGLEKTFDKVVYNYEIVRAIQEGYLSRIRAFRIDTHEDISGVGKVAGDFNQAELAEAVNTPKRNALVVKTYLEKLRGKKALCFAVDVDHTQKLCNTFQEHGVKANFVVGNLPPEIRDHRLQSFRNGKIDVMVNCQILTEGFDESSIQAILLARPTQSGVLFRQMVGRGMRIHEDKKCLYIIDFTDSTSRHKLQTTASLLGIPGRVDFKGEDVLEHKADLERLLKNAPDIDLGQIDIKKIKYLIQEVDVLGQLHLPVPLQGWTNYDWYLAGEDTFRLALPDKRLLEIKLDALNNCLVTYTKDKTIRTTYKTEPLSKVVQWLDEWVARNFKDHLVLIKQDAKWRREKPTEKQLLLLSRMGYNDPLLVSSLTKGNCAQLITRILNKHKSSSN